MGSVLYFGAAILGISLLMILHEGGHYLAARAFGMRVLRFSIGFGPTIFQWQRKGQGTIFQVGALPFLAYVQIDGMNPFEDSDPEDRELFPNHGVIPRIITILAGPFANYLAGSLFVICVAPFGWPHTASIGHVIPGSPAEQGGLRAGDAILAVEGQLVLSFTDVARITRSRAGVPTTYTVRRDGREQTVEVTPRWSPQDRAVLAGVGACAPTTPPTPCDIPVRYVPVPFRHALLLSVMLPWEVTAHTARNITNWRQLNTPVDLTKTLAASARRSSMEFTSLLLFISVAVGAANLMPFPALDGGRLVFLVFELITRRKPNQKVEAVIHLVGMVFLLGLMVFVTFKKSLAPGS